MGSDTTLQDYICEMTQPRLYLLFISLAFSLLAKSQSKAAVGLIIGNVLDGATHNAIPGITITAVHFLDSASVQTTMSDKNGGFDLERMPFGYYRLRFFRHWICPAADQQPARACRRVRFQPGELSQNIGVQTKYFNKRVV